ncbi:MAG: magnesium transporter [Bacteroidia bacterium]
MQTSGITPEIVDMVNQRQHDALREILNTWQPGELAELIEEFDVEADQYCVFNSLPLTIAAQTFEYLDLSFQKSLLKTLSYGRLAGILNEMAPDDRTSLLEELPPTTVTHLLSLLTPKERSVALALLHYPEDSIGRIMTPEYIAVREAWTVKQVLDYIRRYGQDSETLNVIYVVDEKGFLLDDIRVREVLLAQPDKKVSDLMDSSFTSLLVTDDQETAVSAFAKLSRVALPVIDSEGILVGIVTIDDAMEVAQEEDTEDIQKLGAVEALENPYLDVSIFEMVRKRGIWLVVLFLGEMLTASAMGYFEDEIAKAVVLALFIPLIISSGGNTGSQAATLIIRAMALGEVTLSDWWRVMRREIVSGLMLGTILGVIGFARIAIWTTFSDFYGEHWFPLALTVGFSLVGVVLWGTLSGSMFPLILKRFGLDPATSSAPFVATLVDVTGLIIYFSLAMFLLSGTML